MIFLREEDIPKNLKPYYNYYFESSIYRIDKYKSFERKYKNYLKKFCVENGNGDKCIVVANDNEGNGYHGMFYGLTDVSKAFDLDEGSTVEDFGIYDTAEENLENLIILG